MSSRQNLHNTKKEEDFTNSTDVVPAKYPLKVKLENFFTTVECQSWGKLCVPCFLRGWVFYSNVESTPISWAKGFFLMGKILINVSILRNSSHIGILLTKVNRKVQDISI